MNKPQAQQQIQLNPLQLLQITSATLEQLQKWLEGKIGTPDDSHPKKTLEAKASIFHTRLLVNLRYREILTQIAEQQKTPIPPLKPFEPRFVDTESSKLLEKAKTQQGC